MSLPPEQAALQMFTQIFQTSPVVPPQVHRAAWRLACQTGTDELKKRLVARDDAPADLVAEYATLTGTELRGVYLARPGQTPDDLAAQIRGERRATVLTDALQRSRKHPAVLQVAVETFLAKPTRVLAEQLRDLPGDRITPALAEAIVTVYDRTPAGTLLAGTLQSVMAQLGRDRAERLLTDAQHPQIAAQLMRFAVSDEVVNAALRRVLPDVLNRTTDKDTVAVAQVQARQIIRDSMARRTDLAATVSVLTSLLARYRGHLIDGLRADVKQRLTWGAGGNAWAAGAGGDAWAAGAGDDTRVVVSPEDLAAADAVDVSAATPADLTHLAASPHSGVVAAVSTAVAARDVLNGHDRVVRILLQNPLLTVADRRALLQVVRTTPTLRGQLVSLDVISLFPDDDLAREVWCEVFPGSVLTSHGWEPFGGRERAPELIASWARSCDEAVRGAVWEALQAGIDRSVLRVLPWALLQPLWTRGTYKSAGSLVELGAVLAEDLGDNANAWQLFHRLAPEFPGTLEDLVDTCRAAS